ncbi:MAG: hypothetical protein Ta2A_01760 [Treponemataceae bacterium]|nr:MAG: hypothetical protein Ta2A_01760 [Treponemataceae bacterium]
MNKKHFFSLLALFLLPALGLSAQTLATKIINPLPGIWANKQTLVLDLPTNCKAYYSTTGGDPQSGGQEYTGPVLINLTGKIRLRVATVSREGAVMEKQVNYQVFEQKANSAFFNKNLLENPVINYLPGNIIPLDADLTYCFGDESEPTITGRSIAVLSPNMLRRYISCTVSDKNNFWRIVFFVNWSPEAVRMQKVKVDSRVPFELSDWEYLHFLSDRFWFKLDGGKWQPTIGMQKIDRTREHTLYWQDLNGSDISSTVLPAKPNFTGNRINGVLVFAPVDNDSSTDYESHYLLKTDHPAVIPGYVSQFACDTFYGDELSEPVVFDAYWKGIYQGKLTANIALDKKPPPKPVIKPNTNKFFNRDSVLVSFEQDKKSGENSVIHYAVVKKREERNGFDMNAVDVSILSEEIDTSAKYTTYRNRDIPLPEPFQAAALYAVFAYAEDASGNKSNTATYFTIIDPFNFYVSEKKSAMAGVIDGTKSYPYNSLEDVFAMMRTRTFMRVHVSGKVSLRESVSVTAPLDLVGESGCRIVVENNAVFNVTNAAISANNCIFEKYTDDKSTTPELSQLFKLSASEGFFANCTFVTDMGSNGALFFAVSSNIALESCTGIMTNSKYAALFSTTATDVSVKKTNITMVAPTSIAFSSDGGSVLLQQSSVRLVANLGRVANLTRLVARISGNAFSLEDPLNPAVLPRNDRIVPVWFDRDTKIIEYAGNTVYGFARE